MPAPPAVARLPVLGLLAAVSCTGAPAQAPTPPPAAGPDILLITLDTTRADRLGAYGDPLAKTPNLDALAARGALFREAFTAVPLTLPSHATILSGLYPYRHGLRDNGGYRLRDEVPLVSEVLHARGYATAAFVGAYVLDGAWGLSRGFDVYHDDFHPEDVAAASSFGAVERPAREVVRGGLAWWEAQEGPRFLWLHLFDPHRPYAPSQDWTGDPYRGEIFEVDRALRSMLNAVGDDALVIVVGDHGEALWDGGELEHGMLLTRSVLRVPFIVRPPGGLDGHEAPAERVPPARPRHWAPVPGIDPSPFDLDPVPDAPRAARVVEPPVSLVDVAPTLLDYAGAACTDCDGRSLRNAVEGAPIEARPVYSETTYPYHHYGWAPAFAARNTDRRLVRDPDPTLTDPAADPWAQAPLGEIPAPELVSLLDATSGGWDSPAIALDVDAMRQLEALGYATGQVTAPEGPLPSARDRMPWLQRVFLAQGRMASDPTGATRELEAVVARDPGLLDAWLSLSALRIAAGDAEGGLAAVREVLKRSPTHAIALNNEVILLRALGRFGEALGVAEGVLATNPRDARWHRHKVDLLGRLEKPAAVRDATAAALDVAPDDPYLHYMRGLAQLQLHDAEGAIASLTRSRELGSRAPDLELWLGRAHEQLDHIDEAVAAYQAYGRTRPDDLRPAVAAGKLLAAHDRCTDALPLLMTALRRGVRDPEVVEIYRKCGGIGY